jgi:hypothetical protein
MQLLIKTFYQEDQNNKLGPAAKFGYFAGRGSPFRSVPYTRRTRFDCVFLCRQQASWFAHRTDPNAG